MIPHTRGTSPPLLEKIDSFTDFVDYVRQMSTGGTGLADALEIVLAMSRNASCRVVLTVSGAMTVAKQGRILCEMIDRRLVDVVVATGALIAHGLTESIGLVHYRHDPTKTDQALFEQGYNRIYDTLEMEANLNDVSRFVASVLGSVDPPEGVWSSAELCRAVGRQLSKEDRGDGILRSAYQQGVPVFIPAFTDSEFGLDVSTWAMSNSIEETGRDPKTLTPDDVFRCAPAFNPFLDLQEYSRLMGGCRCAGIFTIGGGVPRNWAQQVSPYFDITNERLGTNLSPPRFRYGVRICPEPPRWGGLSGCTYSEGVSWGKFVPKSEGGRFAEVAEDATVVLPLLMKAVFDEMDRADAELP